MINSSSENIEAHLSTINMSVDHLDQAKKDEVLSIIKSAIKETYSLPQVISMFQLLTG